MESVTDIDLAVDVLFDAFETASEEVFEKRRPTNRNKAARWWNPSCEAAVSELKAAASEEERTEAIKQLKKTTKSAKRDWADDYIRKTEVWNLAQWRHGRRLTKVSTLRNSEGGLVYEHAEMADLLANRFFNDDPAQVDPHFTDDPAPVPQRDWTPIGTKEIGELLTKTSNTSSAGLLGIGYQLVKWAWGTIEDYVAALFNACVQQGYHPA